MNYKLLILLISTLLSFSTSQDLIQKTIIFPKNYDLIDTTIIEGIPYDFTFEEGRLDSLILSVFSEKNYCFQSGAKYELTQSFSILDTIDFMKMKEINQLILPELSEKMPWVYNHRSFNENKKSIELLKEFVDFVYDGKVCLKYDNQISFIEIIQIDLNEFYTDQKASSKIDSCDISIVTTDSIYRLKEYINLDKPSTDSIFVLAPYNYSVRQMISDFQPLWGQKVQFALSHECKED